MTDEQALRELNEKITSAENNGAVDWLASILAPRLAFQRADEQKTVDDQVSFLQKVNPGGERVTHSMGPIQVFGDRAVVQCIITDRGKNFHNLRLFVRRGGQWKLLAWANEPE